MFIFLNHFFLSPLNIELVKLLFVEHGTRVRFCSLLILILKKKSKNEPVVQLHPLDYVRDDTNCRLMEYKIFFNLLERVGFRFQNP